MQLFIPVILILIVNSFLYIGPWWHVSGVFNIVDIGNGLLWGCLFWLFPFSKNRERAWNFISLLIVFYIFFVLIQILLAHVYYHQSWLDGLVAVRHQFYYISFFLFLFIFTEKQQIVRFLDLLVIISVISLILGLINYFGPNILSHKYAVDEKLRSGIRRAFVPAMDLLSFSTIWLFVKWSDHFQLSKAQGGSAVFLLAGHIFRQSRMRLVGVAVILFGTLAFKREWKKLFILTIASSLLFVMLELKKGDNILAGLVGSAVTDVMEQTGTMSPRIKMIETDLKEFMRHPWVGGGTSALRRPNEESPTRLQMRTAALSYYHDLGYTHWLKFYGLTGVIWLILFFGYQFAIGIRALNRCEQNDKKLVLFPISYLVYVLISLFTLEHLVIPSRVILITLCAAILVIINKERTPKGANALAGAAVDHA